jgi:hypothetical protein
MGLANMQVARQFIFTYLRRLDSFTSGNIFDQLSTVGELETAAKELQLGELCATFDVTLAVGMRIRDMFDEVAVTNSVRKSSSVKLAATSQDIMIANSTIRGMMGISNDNSMRMGNS